MRQSTKYTLKTANFLPLKQLNIRVNFSKILKLVNIFLIFFFFLIAACNRNSSFQTVTRYYEDGRAKPIVALVPVIDTSSFDLPWSLSDELTDLIRKKLMQKGNVFLSYDYQPPLSSNQNPFLDNDLDWAVEKFSPSEFVVFLELVEHENIPILKSQKMKSNQDHSSNLNMTMRIRVVDIRNKSAKIILQEMIHDSYYISKTVLPTNYNLAVWGTKEYTSSPFAMAHMQLSKEIAERLIDYILLAKSQ